MEADKLQEAGDPGELMVYFQFEGSQTGGVPFYSAFLFYSGL